MGVVAKNICLLTTAHLTNNPRLVKEADALRAQGHVVTVIACRYDASLAASDKSIMEQATWSACIVDSSREGNPRLFWFSRWRRFACLAVLRLFRSIGLTRGLEHLELRAFHRVLPEIRREAGKIHADAFIGHNPGTLPITCQIAARRGAKCGFDAEDLHSGMTRSGEKLTIEAQVVREWESRYLARYDFLTAAAPLIAEEYMDRYPVSFDAVVLNVFDPANVDREQADPRPDTLSLYWISQTIGSDRGLEDAVRALALLVNVPVKLYLRGDWQSGYESRLRRLAADLGVSEDRIVSLPRVSFGELVSSATEYDVGLAVEEPTCRNREVCVTNKIMLYLSAGLAVAATATPAQVGVMTQIPEAGFVFPWRDHEALAEKLQSWVHDPEALRSAKSAALQAAHDRFSWEHEQVKFGRMLERVLQ